MTRLILSLVALMTLAACEEEMVQQRRQRASATPIEVGGGDAPRFNVTRVGVFRDDLAYNDRRGVYVIVDTKTGREFVGVSGVGISELGSHSQPAGKTSTTVQDER